ncbi:meckelin-like isoform X2 [Stegodyphus dumicola]|uniref:meckelin-like isoform X2 n=1 Tax=Stegodyphus dumicola TaxID=202533 RepID=UPI0015ABB5EF|nr:meckelin-like isoform X2 [Stegodyphus dumicola]
MTRIILFSIFVYSFINLVNGNLSIPAITPEYCNSTEYYDSICVRCKRCGRDESQSSLQYRNHDGSCTCKSGFYMKEKKGPHDIICEPCPKGKVSSVDKSKCLACGESNPYNDTMGSCESCINGTLVEDGDSLTCIPCNSGVGSGTERCSACSDRNFASPKHCLLLNQVYSGGYCLPSIEAEPSLFTIKFEELNDTACQALANMCVMLMYKLGINNACIKFGKLATKRLNECPRKKLWLYYIDEEAQWNAERDLHREDVPNVFTPSLAQESSRVYILAMKYALNGTFLGVFKLTSDSLHLCPESDIEEDIAFVFGTHVVRTCIKSLQILWKNSELVFYDLYLVNTKNKSEMYPIPVLIRGINVNGEFVNMGE